MEAYGTRCVLEAAGPQPGLGQPDHHHAHGSLSPEWPPGSQRWSQPPAGTRRGTGRRGREAPSARFPVTGSASAAPNSPLSLLPAPGSQPPSRFGGSTRPPPPGTLRPAAPPAPHGPRREGWAGAAGGGPRAARSGGDKREGASSSSSTGSRAGGDASNHERLGLRLLLRCCQRAAGCCCRRRRCCCCSEDYTVKGAEERLAGFAGRR